MSQPATRRFGAAEIELVQGDITEQRVDAIVNAANSRLAGGGGVDGAIHSRGGRSIMDECRALGGGCATGDAKVTSAGALGASWVIHAVGPVFRDGAGGEAELLASAYRRSLEVADGLGARSVAFPSLSTGAYGYPVDEAATIAVGTIARELASGRSAVAVVRFVLFDGPTFEAFSRALAAA